MPKLTKRQTCTYAPRLDKETYNPFPELSPTSCYERQPKKSPKNSKKVGKCFQLMLICQKLLKPFNTSSKVTKRDAKSSDDKTRSNQKTNHANSTIFAKTGSSLRKTDVCVKAHMESLQPTIYQRVLDADYVSIRECEDLIYTSDKLLKDQYWDLDIDSAIVRDCDSLSSLSLDEEIDPHYATIEIALDGRVVDKATRAAEEVAYTSIYPDNQASCANSCTSSPKSGIYSKIMKPRKNDNFGSLKMDFFQSYTSSRLNFEKMIALRKRTGLSCDFEHYSSSPDNGLRASDRVHSSGTPDIPRRNYGLSVVNYITELRHGGPLRHSCTNVTLGKSPSVVPMGESSSRSHIYSPIWITQCSPYKRTTKPLDTPASEPTAPKRSVDKILHQLNLTYHDDSSEETSSISINSPSRKMYSYPPHFSETISRKEPFSGADRRSHAVSLTEDVNRFRHVDSELDLSLATSAKERRVELPRAETMTNVTVPLDSGEGDLYLLYEENVFLQPLMERSCEEDTFKESLCHL